MIEFELPEPRLRDLTLLNVDADRGGEPGERVVAPLAGRIKVDGPHGFKLTAKTLADDAELSAYVDRQCPFYEYYLVHLAIHFEAVRLIGLSHRGLAVRRCGRGDYVASPE